MDTISQFEFLGPFAGFLQVHFLFLLFMHYLVRSIDFQEHSFCWVLHGATLSASSLRVLLDFAGIKGYKLDRNEKKNLVIVAEAEEGRRILSILHFSNSPVVFIGFVSPKEITDTDKPDEYAGYYLGIINNLKEITELYSINEVIFSARDVSSQEIINQMLFLSHMDVEYKIAPPESLFIIGSNSIEDQGDLYLVDVNAITTRSNKRNKRLLDMGFSVLILISSPVLLFKVKNISGLFSNILNVFMGKLSWVGFIHTEEVDGSKLLRTGRADTC